LRRSLRTGNQTPWFPDESSRAHLTNQDNWIVQCLARC
jgi:hypothetical protein